MLNQFLPRNDPHYLSRGGFERSNEVPGLRRLGVPRDHAHDRAADDCAIGVAAYLRDMLGRRYAESDGDRFVGHRTDVRNETLDLSRQLIARAGDSRS